MSLILVFKDSEGQKRGTPRLHHRDKETGLDRDWISAEKKQI